MSNYIYRPLSEAKVGDILEAIDSDELITEGNLYQILASDSSNGMQFTQDDGELSEDIHLVDSYWKLLTTKPGVEAKINDTVILTTSINGNKIGSVHTVTDIIYKDMSFLLTPELPKAATPLKKRFLTLVTEPEFTYSIYKQPRSTIGNSHPTIVKFTSLTTATAVQVTCTTGWVLGEVDTNTMPHTDSGWIDTVWPITSDTASAEPTIAVKSTVDKPKEQTMNTDIKSQVTGAIQELICPTSTKATRKVAVKTDLEARNRFIGHVYNKHGARIATEYFDKKKQGKQLMNAKYETNHTMIVSAYVFTLDTVVAVNES